MANEENWASYARAVVDFAPPGGPPFRLVPDTPGVTGAWPQELEAPVVIVTAWNPDSVVMPDADNQARSRLLLAEFAGRGVVLWPAIGRDPDSPHVEVGVAVSGLTLVEGVTLAAQYGQASIFVWTPDAWTVVSCSDDRCHTSGWRIDERT